jgi:hypothetical protein
LLSLSSAAAAFTPASAVAMCTKKPDADPEPPVRSCSAAAPRATRSARFHAKRAERAMR